MLYPAERLNCDSEAIRTPDRLLRRQMLYPAELRNQFQNIKDANLFEISGKTPFQVKF
jgi:hypothetical protein